MNLLIVLASEVLVLAGILRCLCSKTGVDLRAKAAFSALDLFNQRVTYAAQFAITL